MLASYGVLKARPIHGVDGRGANAHYQIHMVDDTTEYRIAVNVKSQESPSDLEFLVDDDFRHPITEPLGAKPLGFTPLASNPNSGALDFIRGNLFDRSWMRPLPTNLPGPGNDLNDAVDKLVQAAIAEEHAVVYAYGQRWGPEPHTRDKIFGFLPGNGIHDIHMNQGNSPRFVNDDGVWQDGALLLFYPSVNRWAAVFLKFQSQSWHTDDATGHTISTPAPPGETPQPQPGPGNTPAPGEPDFTVRIVGALVNPKGADQGQETVTLLNVSDANINLSGWAIFNKADERFNLTGTLKAGEARAFTLPIQVPLSNNGGIITLTNNQGLKVHGVSYTKDQVSRQGWTITF
ncbi:MAG: DUF2278 family protein [Bryobacterales bacterium]|nr:DUF2278 family protein [Bryobacterales bacterium]